jgi:signal transduction histidine kinase
VEALVGDQTLVRSVTDEDPPRAVLPGVDVLSKLGHELRGPLNGIIGLARIMLMKISADAVDTGQQARQLEMIQHSADQLLTTVERVADLARLDAVPVPADRDEVDAHPIIADVIATFQSGALARGIQMSANSGNGPVPVPGEPALLRRLVTELVDNAVKYTDASTVRIRATHTADSGAVVEVSDDGPGIPTEHQDELFVPFTRGTAAEERGVSGTGLGLCLARRIATRLGGELSLRSTPGVGSTFRVQWSGHPPADGTENADGHRSRR